MGERRTGAELNNKRAGAILNVMDRQDAMAALRRHKDELHRQGVAHLALFGSVARGEAQSDRAGLKPYMKPAALNDAIHAF